MATLAHSDEHGLWMHFATFEGPTEDSPDVTLIPMVHVANKKFIREAYYEAWRYDFALYEGAYVPMSSVFRHIYPLIARALGLTPQGSGKASLRRQGWKRDSEGAPRERIMVKTINTPDLKMSRRQKQIIADMDKKAFVEAIKDMPLSAKLAFPILLIAFLFIAPFSLTRDDFFDLSEDDFDQDKKSFVDRCMGHYFKYALDDRDAFLQFVLKNGVEACQGHELTLCVQYGQRHMKSLVAFLCDELNYRPKRVRKVLAISRTKNMSFKALQTGYGIAYESYRDLPSNMSVEHQRYDRKMTSAQDRNTALEKMSRRVVKTKYIKLAEGSYSFSREDFMENWADRSKGLKNNYSIFVKPENVCQSLESQENILIIPKSYSADIRYSKPGFSMKVPKPSSSPKNPIQTDKDLVFVVEPKNDAV